VSFGVEVIADASAQWTGNDVRFATYEEAFAYGRDLSQRWTLVTDMRVVEYGSTVNRRWVSNKLKDLA